MTLLISSFEVSMCGLWTRVERLFKPNSLDYRCSILRQVFLQQYNTILQGAVLSRSCPPFPRGKFFIWLASENHFSKCLLWDQLPLFKTCLLSSCPFVDQIHGWVACHRRILWTGGCELLLSGHPPMLRKDTFSKIMFVSWWIWKHHSATVFDNAQHNNASLPDTINIEARSWARSGDDGKRCSWQLLFFFLFFLTISWQLLLSQGVRAFPTWTPKRTYISNGI